MKILAGLTLTVWAFASFAQDKIALRHSADENFTYDFYIYLKDKSIDFEDTLTYFWFKSQKIHTTQGNASGHVLNGPFHSFYQSGQLASQGNFEKGLKDGIWKYYREDGTLIRIEEFKEGRLHGIQQIFDENGNLKQEIDFKKGIPEENEEPEEAETEIKEPGKIKQFFQQRKDNREAKKANQSEEEPVKNKEEKPKKEKKVREKKNQEKRREK